MTNAEMARLIEAARALHANAQKLMVEMTDPCGADAGRVAGAAARAQSALMDIDELKGALDALHAKMYEARWGVDPRDPVAFAAFHAKMVANMRAQDKMRREK